MMRAVDHVVNLLRRMFTSQIRWPALDRRAQEPAPRIVVLNASLEHWNQVNRWS